MKKVLVGLIIFIIIWFAIFLQINLFNVVTFAGTNANVGVVLIVTLGLICGNFVGGIIGLVYGILADITYGKVFGLYALTYMLLGYLCGKIGKNFSKDNKTTIVGIAGIGTILFEIFYNIIGIMMCNFNISILNFIITLFKETIYNMLIAIIIYKPSLLLGEIINKSKNSYYLL